MIPTNIFPLLGRKYPRGSIISLKEAYKTGFGWSVNVYSILPLPVQLRYLKEDGFTQFKLHVRHKTKNDIIICKAEDLSFCGKPAKHRWLLGNLFRQPHSLSLTK